MSERPSDPKQIELLMTPVPDGPDLRWAGPIHQCLCGSNLFQMVGAFEHGEVSFYLLDALCWSCGAKATLPTAIDPPIHLSRDESEEDA